MNMEEILEAFYILTETWAKIFAQLEEVVNTLKEIFEGLVSTPEVNVASFSIDASVIAGQSLVEFAAMFLNTGGNVGSFYKERNRTHHRCPRRLAVCYDYIPTVPRNLPYMRRKY